MTEKIELKIRSKVVDPAGLEDKFRYQLDTSNDLIRTLKGMTDNLSRMELNYGHLEKITKHNKRLKKSLCKLLKQI